MTIGLGAALLFSLQGVVLAGGAHSAAAGPVSTHPLAVNEVLLEVQATGTATAPADQAIFTVSVAGTGADMDAANAALEAQVAALTQRAGRLGVAPGDIAPPDFRTMGFAGNTTDTMAAAAIEAAGDVDSEEASAQANRTLAVTVRRLDRLDQVRQAITTGGAVTIGSEAYRLDDDDSARRQARRRAIVQARATAEDLADAMGMRLGRLVRASERAAPEGDMMQAYRAMLSMMAGATSSDREVEVDVPMSFDFALVPR
ncbi:SIMPL domain-containing protein [Sphingosinicella sp. YJ22]|uniref:SIMPL domain-containing protein n=1 Tax=Sphingosinicella sp. YJ22 TaxID=1104780 RepID=UPI00140D6318|nr:SIMPL domain-containing protein [Sphingosinicella sp. YJ22]